MSIEMTNRELIDLWREEEAEINGVSYKLVEDGEWDGAGEKYQTLDVIFTDGTRFYRGCITRSGSYFSDWNYDDYGDADIEEVEKRTHTIEVTQWEAV